MGRAKFISGFSFNTLKLFHVTVSTMIRASSQDEETPLFGIFNHIGLKPVAQISRMQ